MATGTNARAMSEIVQADFESHDVPDVTHILRAEEGEPSVSNYKKQARRSVDARVLQLISDWLARQIAAPAGQRAS